MKVLIDFCAYWQGSVCIAALLRRTGLCLLLPLWAACGEPPGTGNSVSTSPTDAVQTGTSQRLVVYSSRNEHLIQPVFERYTALTGVDIDYATDKAGVLIQRIKAEGQNTRGDVLLTVDAGTLGFAASQGLFQPIGSGIVTQAVPAYARAANDLWVGLSLRARTVVYSTERVAPGELSTYAALADAKWRGRLCLRTAKKVYNQSLVAMLISQHGEELAEKIVRGWVANLAMAPTSNDTKVMQAIINGQCDVGIVNSYYYGRLQAEQPQVPLALFWPNQQAGEGGVHINVAGIGILKHSKRAAAARAFIEWLVSPDAQALFAGLNQEYPVNSATPPTPVVASWGGFSASELPLDSAYTLQPAAVKLMDRAGYH